MESPLQVDDPMAFFRVHCPTCRRNIWAGYEAPDEGGDAVLEAHQGGDCPGPVDITEDAAPEPTPGRMLQAVTVEESTETLADVASSPGMPGPDRPSGYPTEPAPPFGGPKDSPGS